MRRSDLIIASFGIVLIAIGIVLLLLSYLVLDLGGIEWVFDVLGFMFFHGLLALVVGVGFLYVAFSKRFRAES